MIITIKNYSTTKLPWANYCREPSGYRAALTHAAIFPPVGSAWMEKNMYIHLLHWDILAHDAEKVKT